MSNKKIIFFFLLPVLLSFILHFRVLNLDLIGYHSWRQTQTQTVIYNFTFSDNSILHPQKFDITDGTTSLLYEFPLYQWIIAQVNNCIGYSVLHTRLVTFLMFVFLLFGFYKLNTKLVLKEVALISNALLCFSPLLYYYCINPLPDILALCFSVWALNFFFAFIYSSNLKHYVLFSFFIMLAALVKLPYILFGGVFILYAYRSLKEKKYKEVLSKGFFLLLLLIPVIIWYVKAIPTWKNNDITSGMLSSNKTLIYLLDCFQFNVISTVPELITNYASCIFLVTGMYFIFKRIKYLKGEQYYFIVIFALISIYFLFELNMIEKTHDYYLMPFVPLIFLVVTYGVNYFWQKNSKRTVFIFMCLVPITAWLRIDTRWDINKPGFVPDYLTEQAHLQSLIPENEKCIIDYDDSHFISLYYLKRNGFSLFENELNPEILKDRYKKGANYFITENLAINLNEFDQFNFEEIYNKNLKIYKLSLK
ncbi:MAG: glycosyltransferase family 39 protein [Bacteroidia bacterium]